MYQTNKPRIKIPLTKLDWLMESLCISVLIFNWCYAFFAFGSLPATIPTHFNFNGTVDGFGSKSSIFILPVICTFLFLLLTIIGQFPNTHNYIIKVTEQNATSLYTASSRLLRYLKFFICLILGFVLVEIIQSANHPFFRSSIYLLPLFIIGIIIPVIILLKMGKNKSLQNKNFK